MQKVVKPLTLQRMLEIACARPTNMRNREDSRAFGWPPERTLKGSVPSSPSSRFLMLVGRPGILYTGWLSLHHFSSSGFAPRTTLAAVALSREIPCPAAIRS